VTCTGALPKYSAINPFAAAPAGTVALLVRTMTVSFRSGTRMSMDEKPLMPPLCAVHE
jgi:hypothetical protein